MSRILKIHLSCAEGKLFAMKSNLESYVSLKVEIRERFEVERITDIYYEGNVLM